MEKTYSLKMMIHPTFISTFTMIPRINLKITISETYITFEKKTIRYEKQHIKQAINSN